MSNAATIAVCNGAVTRYDITSTLTDYNNYTWTATNGTLYNDAGATSLYVAGTNTSFVYFVGTTAGAATVTSNANNTVSGCSATAVTKNITVLPSAITAAATSSTICVSGTTTISLTPSTAASYTSAIIQWQSSPDGVTWTNIGSANGVSYTTAIIIATTWYRAQVLNSSSSLCLTSNTVMITVNSPSVTGTTTASRCGNGTVNLSATGSAGTVLNWYAASTGGAPLGTGNSFATPVISTTTTYYVAASISSSNVTLGLAPTTSTCGTISNSSASVWPMRFNTLVATTLVSVDVIANTAGTYNFTLANSGSSTAIITSSAALTAGVNTVMLNWPVSAAGSYQIFSSSINLARISTFTCTYPFTSPSGAVSITGSSPTATGTTNTTSYNCFFNLVFSETCSSARTSVTATVNPAPALSVNTTAIDICSGTPSDPVILTSSSASFSSYSWNPSAGVTGTVGTGWTFNPSTNTTYTLTGSQSGGAECVNQLTVTVNVKPLPTAPAVTPATPVAICSGGTQTITASAAGTATNLINENFETFSGTTLANGWTSTNTSAGGTVSSATWRTRNSGYSYLDSYTGYSVFDFYSNDNSRFMLTNSDQQDGTTTNTTLQMPAFNTTGKVSANMVFYHNYLHNIVSDSATIEISTNGTSWNPLKVYKSTQGFVAYYDEDLNYEYYYVDMVKDSINLPAAYLNQPSVYIRFKYQTGYSYWWALDNVKVSATNPASISWTANPAIGAGLPVGAGTASVANSSIMVNPTEEGAIQYLASVTGTNGCKGTSIVTINVSANQWVGPNSGGDWNLASNWCGGVPTASSNVVIPATAVVDIKTANALARSVTIQGPGGGIQMLNTFNLTISNNGSFNNSGTLNAASSTGAVVFAGNATISGTTIFKNVEIEAGGVDFGTNSTIGAGGSLTLKATSAYVTNNAPFYDCASTLIYNSGGNFNRWIEWATATSGKGFPGNVSITGNTTLNYTNGSAAARALCGSLTIDNNSGLYMEWGGFNATAPLTVGGDVVLNGGLGLSYAAGGDIEVKGNWRRGATGVLQARQRAVIFNGNGLQTINRPAGLVEDAFDYLVINKTAGNVQLNNTVQLNYASNEVLQLLGGDLNLNNHDLRLNNNGGNILVSGAARTINGPGTLFINGNKTVVGASAGSLVTAASVVIENNAAMNFGANLTTINGTLQLNAGSFVDINAPYYGSTSLLKYNSGGLYDRRLEWKGIDATDPGYPNDVLVTNNTTLQPGGPGNPGSSSNITFNTRRHLTIDAGSAVYMDATNKAMLVPLRIGGNLTIAGALSASSATGGDVYVGGNWVRSGTFNHNNRAVFFDGSSNATLSATNGQELAYVYITKTAATLQLLDSIAVRYELGPQSGTLDLAAKDITLLSDSTATARVAPITGNILYGTGRFNVHRYIRYTGNWNLIGSPTTEAQNIRDSWQEGGALPPAMAGVGTRVTGPTHVTGDGLDNVSVGHSMKYWKAATQRFEMITNTIRTDSPLVNHPTGFFLFARGDRFIGNGQTGGPTTLRSRGKIYSPALPAPVTTATSPSPDGFFISVANPYASAIDFDKVLERQPLVNSSRGIKDLFHLWDPTPGGNYSVGRYITFIRVGGTWITTTPDGLYRDSGYSTIQSGQAFYVEADRVGTSSVSFAETDKLAGSRTVTRGNGAPLSMISTVLHNSAGLVADGNKAFFSVECSNQLGREDARKMINTGENFGLRRAGQQLAAEGHKPLMESDTLFYHMTNLQTKQYKLSFEPTNIAATGLTAELVDKFTNTRSYISLTDSTWYTFSATADAASKAADRFMLVFRAPAGPLPVRFVAVAAQRQADRTIAVNWKVANEVNINRYEVQRSANGSAFSSILTNDATGAATYGKVDLSPLSTDNFYR
ncbi:MAG: hypothetical protein EOP51_13910, partial [Sphingobacteriales bacterium]